METKPANQRSNQELPCSSHFRHRFSLFSSSRCYVTMGTLFGLLVLGIIFTPLIISSSLRHDNLLKPKNSTFGYNFKMGMNRSCSKEFFNSSDENDCRIYYIDSEDGSCGDITFDNKIEETEELNVQPNLFLRAFDVPDYVDITYIGLNISIPVLKKDTRGYMINVDIQKKTYHRCQVIRINSEKLREKSVLWSDQFFFKFDDEDRNFTVKVTEIPSGKQQTFYSKVPALSALDMEMWKPVIFMQHIDYKIVILFFSAPFTVNGYTVELMKGSSVDQTKLVSEIGSFQKVEFSNLDSLTYYCARVRANCDTCIASELCFNSAKGPSPVPKIITCSVGIFVILVALVVAYTRFEKKPKVKRKVLILQSYDCEAHSEFIFALVKALRKCECEVLIDKYRDVEGSKDFLDWIPDAIIESDIVLIVWSRGALNKDNQEFELREPGKTVSSKWNFALLQVETKLNEYNFSVGNVFWDKTIKKRDIKHSFIGFENIFLTNGLKKGWKDLISFVYSKDISFWKRKTCKLYGQDLRSVDKEKELLTAYNNLKLYKLETFPRERNEIREEEEQIQPEPLVAVGEPENHDSGFDSEMPSGLPSVESDHQMPSTSSENQEPVSLALSENRRPQMSVKEALNRAFTKEDSDSQCSSLPTQSSMIDSSSLSMPYSSNQQMPSQPMMPIQPPYFAYQPNCMPIVMVPQNQPVFHPFPSGSFNSDSFPFPFNSNVSNESTNHESLV